jgi:predicted methyltransferase MtxX (methanogen marker protein 4)
MSSNNKTNQDNDLNATVDNELHDLGVDLVDQNELEKSLMEKVKKKKA